MQRLSGAIFIGKEDHGTGREILFGLLGKQRREAGPTREVRQEFDQHRGFADIGIALNAARLALEQPRVPEVLAAGDGVGGEGLAHRHPRGTGLLREFPGHRREHGMPVWMFVEGVGMRAQIFNGAQIPEIAIGREERGPLVQQFDRVGPVPIFPVESPPGRQYPAHSHSAACRLAQSYSQWQCS